MQKALSDGSYEEEEWRLKKDGTRFWAGVTITALRDHKGVHQGFSKVTRDLTQKKIAEENLRQSEERLRLSEERFRLMIEGVADYAIFMLDPDGHVRTWNAGAERNKGYKDYEIIGQHFSKFYPPEDITQRKPEREIEEAIRHGRVEDFGWRIRKDGSRFWANVVITAIRDKTGTLIGFSKVTRDLTERKKAEAELQTAYEGLERRVIERTLELEKAKDEAEKAVRSSDEFFSIASRELRTPLTSLKLKAQIAKRILKPAMLETPVGAQFQKYIHDNEEQLDRLVTLIEDMLDLTRVGQGRLPLSQHVQDLSEIARGTAERFGAHFHERDLALNIVLENGAFASIDRARMEQVLANLLTNALRYAPKSDVVIKTEILGGTVRLSVRDEGPGIALADQSRIFNRYERLVPSAEVSGLGIGLYLCRSIVQAQGGTIRVESEPGQGACFIIEFPFHPPLTQVK